MPRHLLNKYELKMWLLKEVGAEYYCAKKTEAAFTMKLLHMPQSSTTATELSRVEATLSSPPPQLALPAHAHDHFK